jgi:hypothetical protein
MTNVIGHIAGMPLEETVAMFGPVLLASGGYWLAVVRSRLGR